MRRGEGRGRGMEEEESEAGKRGTEAEDEAGL